MENFEIESSSVVSAVLCITGLAFVRPSVNDVDLNGLFQKVKIHPHGRLLINLDGFLAKISSFPDGLATALNLMDS